MMIRKIFVFLWSVTAFSCLTFASGAGTTSGLFLRQEPTARVFSMGGVSLPLINEPGAAYINPSVLGHITGHHIALSMWKGLDAVSQYNFLGIVLNAGRVGAFGLNYLSYDSGSEEMYDINGALSKITLQKDYAVSVGWGRNITERLFIGGQVKSVNSELAQEYNANAVTFDAGAMFKSLDDRLTIGGGIQNINGELKYKNTGDPLPRIIRGGIGYRFAMGMDNVIIGADVQKPVDEDSLSGGFGVEYGFAQLPVALRGGIKRINDEMGFSVGMGTKWKGIEMDYGFQPAGNLGETT
ncbi:MAG: PorV/PorQ family protein, partial [Elusimicrobiales bacterium]|nr:PorV/PorQ family protein [Elusimicrobiales bacterium]